MAAVIALPVTAGLAVWFGPVEGPYLYFKMGPVTVLTLWLVLRACLSLASSMRRPPLAQHDAPQVYLTDEGWRRGDPAVRTPRAPALILVLLLTATAALLYGGPLGGGPLSDFGFRVFYASEARTWVRDVIANPERYVSSDAPPDFLRPEGIPSHLRRLGWARLLGPATRSGITVSEPVVVIGKGGGFGSAGYVIGADSLRAKSASTFYTVHRVAPGVYRFVEY